MDQLSDSGEDDNIRSLSQHMYVFFKRRYPSMRAGQKMRKTDSLSKEAKGDSGGLMKSKIRKRRPSKSREKKNRLMEKYKFKKAKRAGRETKDEKKVKEKKGDKIGRYKSKYKDQGPETFQESEMPARPECRVF